MFPSRILLQFNHSNTQSRSCNIKVVLRNLFYEKNNMSSNKSEIDKSKISSKKRQNNNNVFQSASTSNNTGHNISPCGNRNSARNVQNRRCQQTRASRSEESINSQFVLNPFSTHVLANYNNYETPLSVHNYSGFNTHMPCHFLQRTLSQPNCVEQNFSRQYFSRYTYGEMGTNPYCDPPLDVQKLRSWEKVKDSNGRPGFNFTLMSYNVLAQDLVNQHQELYRSHKPQDLSWSNRWANLLHEIRYFDPDILCLQEVQESHIEHFFSKFEAMGYVGIFKKRTGQRTDGCAIYYKIRVLKLLDFNTVEFNQPNVAILNRDNVGIIAKFSPFVNTNKEFVIATTHLLYNPRRTDVRLAQMQLLLTEIERMSFKEIKNSDVNVYLPVILSGDLNSSPDSAVYNFITNSVIKYDTLSSKTLEFTSASNKNGKLLIPPSLRITDNCQHIDDLEQRLKKILLEQKHPNNLDRLKVNHEFSSGTLSHNFALKSVYSHYQHGNFEGTTFQDKWITVDYIFYSGRRKNNHIEDEDLQLLSRYKLPTEDQLKNVKIPNNCQGSDHLSLLAKFKLKF